MRGSPALCHNCTRQCWESSVYAEGGTEVNPGGAPEEEVRSEVALLPPDAASEGVSQGTGAPVCTAVEAKKEQLINLILKQIYKIASGFAGSRRQWLPGERAGREEPCSTSRQGPCFSASLVSISSLEAEPENGSGRTSAMLAAKRNNSKILSKCFQHSGH